MKVGPSTYMFYLFPFIRATDSILNVVKLCQCYESPWLNHLLLSRRVSWLWILPLIKPCHHYYHNHHHAFLIFWFIVIFCKRSKPSLIGGFLGKGPFSNYELSKHHKKKTCRISKDLPKISFYKNMPNNNDKHFAAPFVKIDWKLSEILSNLWSEKIP